MKSGLPRLYNALPRSSNWPRLYTNAVKTRKTKSQTAAVVLPLDWSSLLSDAHHHPPLFLHRPLKLSQTHYRLDVAAYGIPKQHHTLYYPPDPLHLAVQVGEDAYFIRGNALGVADGVGGWNRRAQHCYNPSALFARRLMHHTASQFSSDISSSQDILTILDRAYNNTVKAHTTPTGTTLHTGSSTALIAYLDDSLIHLVHVGDSMGMVVRDTQIVWRSDEMLWGWNTPVQLSPPPSPPPRTIARIFTVPVLPDDILILASDGLSDNLWDEDVLDEVTRFRRSTWPHNLGRDAMARILSEALCSRARSVSERKPKPPENHDDETPFSRRATQAGKQFAGGKRDDISVLVAIVAPASR